MTMGDIFLLTGTMKGMMKPIARGCVKSGGDGPQFVALYKTGRTMISHENSRGNYTNTEFMTFKKVGKNMVFNHWINLDTLFCICCNFGTEMPEKKHARKTKHVFEVE